MKQNLSMSDLCFLKAFMSKKENIDDGKIQ